MGGNLMGRKLGLGIMAASLVAAGAARVATSVAIAEEEGRRERMAGADLGILTVGASMFDAIRVLDESHMLKGQTIDIPPVATFDSNTPLPDRLSVNPESPFYDAELLKTQRFGVRFDGKDRPGDVEEYCISEGWIRVQTYLANGKVRRERGKIICLKKWGKVEPYRK
jgi:hypothetical protein